MHRILLATLFAALAAAAPAATAHSAAGPTPAQTIAAADALGVGAQARALQDHFLPGARLVAAPGRSALGATRLGGAPDLPRATTWPSCDHHPLTFVGQLSLSDLRTAVPGATRGTGLLSIFMGTREAPDGAPEAAGVFAVKGLARVGKAKCFAVRHTPPAARLVRRASPRGSTPFAAAPQQLRPVLTVPGWEISGDKFGVSFLGDDAAGDAWDQLQERAAAGTLGATPAGARATRQLLGWSNPLDRDPAYSPCAGQPSRLLLQLDSTDRYDLDQSEGGSLMLVIGAADLRAGRFDRLCAEHQLD
jgi:hypothetical protein